MNQLSRFRHRAAARLARPSDANDRRRYQRFVGSGMMARIGQAMHEVTDLSLGGLRLPFVDHKVGEVVKVQLIPRDGTKLLLNDALYAEARVAENGPAWTGLEFTTVSYTLAKLIIRHMARVTGVEPFHFR